MAAIIGDEVGPEPIHDQRLQDRQLGPKLTRKWGQDSPAKPRIHVVAADHGYDRTGSYWTGPGRGWLAELDLPAVSREITTDCLAFIDTPRWAN